MKQILLILSIFAVSLLPSGAVGLDVEAFGAALHGWRKDRTASYTINNHRYTTHRPTATLTHDGGLFVSTRIEEGGRFATGTVSFLELTFSPSGELVAGQIRATMKGKRLDTGLVTRQPVTPALPGEEGGNGPEASPHAFLVADLFSQFDAELKKLDGQAGERPRRDIFGRLTGAANQQTDLPAAIRHNLNLLLTQVHPGGVRAK